MQNPEICSPIISNENVIEYARHIVRHTSNFHDFALAIMEHIGRVDDSIFLLYESLKDDVELGNVKFEDGHSFDNYPDWILDKWYAEFLEEKAKIEEDIIRGLKQNIDELQFLIENYRDSDRFKEMLDFVGKFRYLAPYNAMLVEMQLPGAQFVFNGRQWRKYFRRPKPNARQLITLVPFGPVQVMFEFSDTEPIPGKEEEAADEAKLMKEWDDILIKTKGQVDKQVFQRLITNLTSYGIYLDTGFSAANSYGGYIMPYDEATLDVRITKDLSLRYKSCFLISVNSKQSDESQFHTICHELGHLFCRHQNYDINKRRRLTLKQREFEAETVAWLLCKRHGVSNPSEEYLATYAPKGEIPVVSLDIILKAVTEIEDILARNVYVTDTKWYKADEKLHKLVDDALKADKAEKAKQSRKKPVQGSLFPELNGHANH